MGNSVIMDKYTKLAEALKSRGYKMRVGKDSSCKTSILKVSIFPVRENYSFVQDYVYINCYPIMDEDGFILPNLEFCVRSSMDFDGCRPEIFQPKRPLGDPPCCFVSLFCQ